MFSWSDIPILRKILLIAFAIILPFVGSIADIVF